MKEYKPKITAASVNIRYALMSMGAEATCAYVLFKTIAGSASPDKLAILTVLFNIIAVMLRPIVSIFADRVKNKHTGVRLGTLLIVLGYYFPVSFGVSTKVVILALGSCFLHSFAASSILYRDSGKSAGISLFLGGSVMGLAFYTFAPFLCHILTALLMACAIPDDTAEEPESISNPVKAPANIAVTVVASILLLSSYSFLFYGFSSLNFEWAGFFKTKFLILAAIAIGRGIGGIISDKLGRLFTVCAGALGGSLIIAFCSDSKKLCLVGLILLSMPLGPMITSLSKRCTKNSGFVFALFSATAYLGQELTFYVPMKRPIIIILIGAGALLAVAASEAPAIITLLLNSKEGKNENS